MERYVRTEQTEIARNQQAQFETGQESVCDEIKKEDLQEGKLTQ